MYTLDIVCSPAPKLSVVLCTFVWCAAAEALRLFEVDMDAEQAESDAEAAAAGFGKAAEVVGNSEL